MAGAPARPLVGITTDRIMAGAHPAHATGEKYIDAVVRGADAAAVLLPSLGHDGQVADWLAALDGLLFTGSYSNVEPARYGAPASAPGTLHDAARDGTALPLMRAAIEAGVPVLAICRGLQEMNVVFGGTLHPLVHEVPGRADHRERKDAPLAEQYAPAHAVRLAEGGLLRAALRARGVEAGEARVNSLHAQGIARLGDGLAVEATASDGLIEAIRVDAPDRFALGVQWHPEWRFAEDPLSTALLAAFGRACRARRERRRAP